MSDHEGLEPTGVPKGLDADDEKDTADHVREDAGAPVDVGDDDRPTMGGDDPVGFGHAIAPPG